MPKLNDYYYALRVGVEGFSSGTRVTINSRLDKEHIMVTTANGTVLELHDTDIERRRKNR